ERTGHYVVPGRMAGAGCGAGLGAVVCLVFWKAAWVDRTVHLGAGYFAAVADGSADEFRLEIYAADVVGQSPSGRRVAFHRAWIHSLAGLLGDGAWPLFRAWARPV